MAGTKRITLLSSSVSSILVSLLPPLPLRACLSPLGFVLLPVCVCVCVCHSVSYISSEESLAFQALAAQERRLRLLWRRL